MHRSTKDAPSPCRGKGIVSSSAIAAELLQLVNNFNGRGIFWFGKDMSAVQII